MMLNGHGISEYDRASGYIRPIRTVYKHELCNELTILSDTAARKLAMEPRSAVISYCCGCRKHFASSEFTWVGSDEEVGS